MNFVYYGAALASCLFVFAFLFLLRKKNIFGEKLTNTRLVALIYSALFFVRFLGGVPLIQKTIGLNIYSPFGPQGMMNVLIAAVLFWLIYTVQLAGVLYPFFEKHIPLVAPIVRYVAAVVYAGSIATLPILNRAMDGDLADGFHYRLLIFAIELGVGLGLAVFQIVKPCEAIANRHVGIKARLKNAFASVAVFVGMLVISLPHWLPQAVFGYGDDSIILNDFTTAHRIVLYGSILFAVAVHFLFAKREYEQRRFALLYISMATMITFCYNYDFSVFVNLQNWPLHLCNTAMFIIPLVLIFKMERLYYFTIFINVLGAFFAMIMPNLGDDVNWLEAASLQFWSNHYMAMLLPLLLMSLQLFNRPKMKQFIYSLVAFFGYYLLVLFMNPWLTAQGHSVDFFFINSNFIAEKLGEWAEDLRKITFEFQLGDLTMLIYPVYQSLYFLVYVALSFAMWFLYEQVFEITDTYEIITERNRKIKADRLALEAQLAGRSMQEPMNPQNEGKLILRDFSKRYSTSDVYAVYKAKRKAFG